MINIHNYRKKWCARCIHMHNSFLLCEMSQSSFHLTTRNAIIACIDENMFELCEAKQ